MNHEVVSSEEWGAARRQLLAKEKEFTRLRDELSRTLKRGCAITTSTAYRKR